MGVADGQDQFGEIVVVEQGVGCGTVPENGQQEFGGSDVVGVGGDRVGLVGQLPDRNNLVLRGSNGVVRGGVGREWSVIDSATCPVVQESWSAGPPTGWSTIPRTVDAGSRTR